ncbi:MAG: hypothetical protein AAF481_12545 [Acidobacteriota bacterium]
MSRAWPVYLALLVLVLALGGFVWLSRFPESPAVESAESWPLAGPWIAELRRGYLPPEPPEPQREPAEGAAAEPVVPAGPIDLTGSQNAAGRIPKPGDGDAGELWLGPGDRLYRGRSESSPVVAEVDAFSRVLVLERRGAWRRVRTDRRQEGWVRPIERARAGEPPLGNAPEPARPLPGQAPDPERLEAALDLLGVGGPAGEIGPYPLFTDVVDVGLVTTLDRLAGDLERAYFGRYGRSPRGQAREAVVLFDAERAYRRFQNLETPLVGLPASGHAAAGLVALYRGERRRDELHETLVHEVVHLLNRRALGPALPPWLDEGLADDLASCRIGPAGGLDISKLGGSTVTEGDRKRYFGPPATLRLLAYSLDRDALPSLAELTALDWQGFVRSDLRDLYYAYSGFFVRYLLEGEGGALADPFRRFLAAVSEGDSAAPASLWFALGREAASLDAGFAEWVRAEAAARADYEPPSAPVGPGDGTIGP